MQEPQNEALVPAGSESEEPTEAREPSSSSVPASAFEDVPSPLDSAMAERGFEELTKVQSAVLEANEGGRDLQISSQTGSGKTVALGLVISRELLDAAPAEVQGPRALVLVPTRELAQQLGEELGWLYARVPGVRVECVTGGTSLSLDRKRLARRPAVLVGTPGRLLDHLTSGVLSCASVRELVLDEADQMLDMGFREELEAILERTPRNRRTHLVSATFPPEIRALAERFQSEPMHVQGTDLGAAHQDIEHVAHLVTEQSRYSALVNLLLLAGDERTLVFVNTRVETTLVAEQLASDGFSALPLSGELQQSQRTRTLNAFRNGTISVLVATDVAGRGLDVPDVATVIHAAPAMDSEVYTHRSGRTGRAGKKGRSVILAPARSERRLRRMLHFARVDVDWQPIPDADNVRKALRKRARRMVYEAIDEGPDPQQDQLEFARRLMENRDPLRVLAMLLDERDKSAAPTEPRHVPIATTRPDRPGRFGRGSGEYRDRSGRSERRGFQPYQGGGGDYVHFSINWGSIGGANPKRLMAHICRRGGVTSRAVGAIRIDSHSSSFEIAEHVSQEFESRTRERDARDPKLHIRRAKSQRGSYAARSGGGRPNPR